MSTLIRPNLTFNRSAIMRAAWAEFRDPMNRPGILGRKSFGQCLAYAWRVARNLRARMADGSHQRARAEYAARETLRQQLEASLSAEHRAAGDAWLIRQCSTDGRLPEHRNA